jgi:uncharacterized membrane protein YsdA (DUF1294 family)
MIFLAVILLYLVWINMITYRAFAADKQFAINKEQRTPEATLLSLAQKGGWIGAKIAQQRLRHKSYKQPFGNQLDTIGRLQAACLVTIALVLAGLTLAPTTPAVVVTAAAAVPEAQPAGAPPTISRRPPAARP